MASHGWGRAGESLNTLLFVSLLKFITIVSSAQTLCQGFRILLSVAPGVEVMVTTAPLQSEAH